MRQIGSLLIAILIVSVAFGQVSQMEREYLSLAERYEARTAPRQLEQDLRTYLVLFPYTTYLDEIHFMDGVLLEERGLHKKALKELELVDFKSLTRPHQPEYQFYRGYAYMMLQRYENAATYFNILKKRPSEYQTRGAYYYAYCMYKLGTYDKALPALLELETNKTYSKTIPYYIVQVYYAKGDYEQVTTRAAKLLSEQPNNHNNAELHRMLGEIAFQNRDYQSAVSHLKTYETLLGKAKAEAQESKSKKGNEKEDNAPYELVRNDVYLLGASYYHLKDYQQAINYLRKVEVKRDSLSESVYLCLGHAFMQQGNIEQAKQNYLAAYQSGLNSTVREEALYNYALTTYQSSSALGESVNAFTDFLKQYPGSKYEDNILALLSDAFRQSKNYEAALKALESIESPNRKLLEAKQFLRYQLAIDSYLQGQYQKASDWFTAVIDDPVGGLALKTETYYLRAETDYALGRYEDCAKDLKAFYASSKAKDSPNLSKAKYLSGYNHFALKNYPSAKADFEDYLKVIMSTDPTYADALNRLGDCAFNARAFNEAINYYQRAIDYQSTAGDYSYFQKGYAEGLQRNYSAKIKTMQALVSRYPKSDYADDALYEIARTYLIKEDERAALQAYEQLLASYPRSEQTRKSCLERAMLYTNLGETDKAIAAYKQTIERFPATEEAYTALSGLEALYVETNQVDQYVAYSKTLGKYHMTSSFREDSLRYTAHYLAAVNYYKTKDYEKALKEYKALTTITGNPYMVEALTRAAEISYDKASYKEALGYFRQLIPIAPSRDNLNMARLGVLRCQYNLNDTEATIAIATDILEDEPVSESMRLEALYDRAKAYMAKKQYGQAIVDWTPLAEEVRTAQGAEAKYQLANCAYQLGAYDNAEQEIMSFAEMNTQHQYWLAKSLILLADINQEKGDTFQARQYLLTLLNNYRANDDILTIVHQRLQALDAAEEQLNGSNEEEDNDEN